jgi:hypothetical protein
MKYLLVRDDYSACMENKPLFDLHKTQKAQVDVLLALDNHCAQLSNIRGGTKQYARPG